MSDRVHEVSVSPAAVAAVAEANDDWLRRYAFYMVLLDAVVLGATGILAVLLRFGLDAASAGQPSIQGVSYFLVAGLAAAVWLAVLGLSRSYETRYLGTGTEEYRRVADACLRMTALFTAVSFALNIPVSRGFAAPFLLLGTLLLFLVRAVARGYLQAGRRSGRWTHRVLLVGGRAAVADLALELSREKGAGYTVVGACVPGGAEQPVELRNGTTVPVVGAMTRLKDALLDVRADTVAVAGAEVTGEALRRLSYELEGTGVALLVAPALTNISGTRVSIRPVAGLPLLHLDEPEFTGARRVLKFSFDVVVASLLVVLLAPLLLGIAAVVRATSAGPAIFSQERVGRAGRLFRVYKFRTMHVDAEHRLADLRHLNEHDGVLFKLRDDPRITSTGRWLRRYSLDELPQLFNVLRGQMSLVGPRPPLESEVARYEGHAHRRLLVKPGITGLWQVSGRSDLSWEDTVRLDLQYVENWSLGLDVALLARTAVALVTRRGAY